MYGGCEFFARRVSELSDNKFQIQVFAAGEIVPGLQVLDAVQNGTVECGHTSPYYYFGKDPTFTFGTDLPFGMNVRMRNAWLYHGGGLDLINEFSQGLQHAVSAGRKHQLPDGRMVSQGDHLLE